MNKKIIAVYGGSFNPPTIAHEKISKDILSLNNVDKFIYLPVGDKYEKPELISSFHRLNMLEIMVNEIKKSGVTSVEVSDLEVKSKNLLYTIDSLRAIKNRYKDKDVAFVMGTDNLIDFENWEKPIELLEEFYFIVIERKNQSVEEILERFKFLKKYTNKFIILKKTSYEAVNSTFIRENINNISLIKDYVNKEVLEYININNLYGGTKHE
ncbi:nicotinate (nicotinamide) nucleotide adenylyltransferase [Clostridium massiliamazoniense]|uniref:nicotinate (nicotinamide) nucleotide adenylyltransferase n=1 Tax=Clostridium massiliamazoniense TaxID=1347366 RepID=UPI0006D7BCF8|nr:nicotinate (nicotinamide) nucleotide adenylyltransferase [Clostridium massiliamazoniense]